jgi:hypothetical protein
VGGRPKDLVFCVPVYRDERQIRHAPRTRGVSWQETTTWVWFDAGNLMTVKWHLIERAKTGSRRALDMSVGQTCR